jgi:hypothetical protein
MTTLLFSTSTILPAFRANVWFEPDAFILDSDHVASKTTVRCDGVEGILLTLLVHMAVTWAMVGFIWTIQILQYPLMAEVPAEGFARFEAVHRRRVTAVIALFGPLEVVTAALVFLTVETVPRSVSFSSGAVLAVIWTSTAFFYAPLHARLSSGFDETLHRRLLRTNWLRTVAWTVRGLAVAWMLTF